MYEPEHGRDEDNPSEDVVPLFLFTEGILDTNLCANDSGRHVDE